MAAFGLLSTAAAALAPSAAVQNHLLVDDMATPATRSSLQAASKPSLNFALDDDEARLMPFGPSLASYMQDASLEDDCSFGRESQATFLVWADANPPPMQQYLNRIYGIDGARVDAGKLGYFWDRVPNRSSVAVTWQGVGSCLAEYRPQRMWAPLDDAWWEPQMRPPTGRPRQDTSLALEVHVTDRLRFPGAFIRRAPDRLTTPLNGVPDNTWVELVRISRVGDSASQPLTSILANTQGQVWFWLGLGSGIWWNTGKSKVLIESPEDNNRITCEQASAQGYDSIQVTRSFQGYSYEIIDCRGVKAVPATHNVVFDSACPPQHVELRTGLPTPRYAPALAAVPDTQWEPCRCDRSLNHLNCAAGP